MRDRALLVAASYVISERPHFPVQSCHKDSWRLALQQWQAPALIKKKKKKQFSQRAPPGELAHQSSSSGEGLARACPAFACKQVKQSRISVSSKNTMSSQRRAAACYHRIFLAVWRLIRALGALRGAKGGNVHWSTMLCDMHVKSQRYPGCPCICLTLWPVSFLYFSKESSW